MNTKDFWRTYTGGMQPAELIIQFQSRNPKRCAEHYAARMPGMFGIMRRNTWKESFRAPVQHVREEIASALAAYLDETRAEWEPIVAEYDRQAAETRRNNPPPPAPVETAPVQEASVEETPVEAAPVEETPAEATPVEKTVAESAEPLTAPADNNTP